MKGLGRAVLLLLAQPLIRIRELRGRGGLAASVPVKVIVCATSGVVRYRRMTGVPLRTYKSDRHISGGSKGVYAARRTCSLYLR